MLRLALAGQTRLLSQVGPDFILLRDLPTLSEDSASGRVDVIVDDRVASSRSVFLPYGIVSGNRRVTYF